MSDTDDIESIRERKREQLLEQTESGGDGSRSAGRPEQPIHVDGPDQFSDLTSEGVVLVDFHADWCGPCKMLEPTIQSLADESDATVAKVDIDAQQAIAAQYGVRSVPTVMLFADGEAVERIVGVQDRSAYESAIAQYA